MNMFESCLFGVYHIGFGMPISMPLRSADLYLWYGRVGMECLDEFVLLSLSGGDPIVGTCF